MLAAGASVRDRWLAGFGTAIVLALFGYLLVRGLTVGFTVRLDRPMAMIDLRAPPPRVPELRHARPKHAAASPLRDRGSEAAPIVIPPPIVPPPPTLPVVVAPRPGIGTTASTGTSDRSGPGQGADEGNAHDGDGDGDGDTPPRQIRGRLKASDLPADLREAAITGAVAVRYRVENDGRVTGCSVTKSSGYAELDAATCRLIEQRFRFEPGHDSDGNPFRSTIVETHEWATVRSGDATP